MNQSPAECSDLADGFGSAIASRSYGFEATHEAVRSQSQTILTELFNAGLSMPDTISKSEILLGEVLNNIVEHSYADTTGDIEISWFLTDDTIWFETRDRGKEMPGATLPNPDCPPNDVALEDMPEGGFGWFMINQLAQEISYQRTDGINVLKFAIPRVG